MLLAQVEGFVEIARQGNLSRAAVVLHVTQPALTARIHGLEDEVGMPLFTRGRRGMELTDAGRALLPYAERALTTLHDGAGLLADLERGSVGELVIGAAPAVSTYVLPGVLVRFVARFPSVRLVVRTGHSEEILDMAVRGDIQVGLVRELAHPQIESVPWYDDELVLVVQPGHRFADAGAIAIERITEDRLILFDRTSSYYDLTNTLFRQAGVVPRGVMELDNIDAAKEMVYQGLGVAFLPRTAIAGELASGHLTAIRIAEAAPIRRRIVAIRRRDLGAPVGVVAGFLEVLADDAADRAGHGSPNAVGASG